MRPNCAVRPLAWENRDAAWPWRWGIAMGPWRNGHGRSAEIHGFNLLKSRNMSCWIFFVIYIYGLINLIYSILGCGWNVWATTSLLMRRIRFKTTGVTGLWGPSRVLENVSGLPLRVRTHKLWMIVHIWNIHSGMSIILSCPSIWKVGMNATSCKRSGCF